MRCAALPQLQRLRRGVNELRSRGHRALPIVRACAAAHEDDPVVDASQLALRLAAWGRIERRRLPPELHGGAAPGLVRVLARDAQLTQGPGPIAGTALHQPLF